MKNTEGLSCGGGSQPPIVCSQHPLPIPCKSCDLNDDLISSVRWWGSMPARLQNSLCFFRFWYLLSEGLETSGIKIWVPLTSFFPRYPLSPYQYFDLSLCQAFNLCQQGFYRVSIIFITKRLCAKNNSRSRADDGYLVAKFVLLMFFTLADALHLRLVNRINLFPTMTPLG